MVNVLHVHDSWARSCSKDAGSFLCVLPVQALEHVLQLLEHDVGVLGLKDESRPDTDGGVAAAADQHARRAHLADDAVPAKRCRLSSIAHRVSSTL